MSTKLITIQHKNVIGELRASDFYECKAKSEYHKRTPQSYQFLASKTNPACSIPIFTWEVVIPGTDLCASSDQLRRMNEMTGFPEDSVVLVLEVPDEHVLRTNFYEFVTMRCIEEGIDDESGFRNDFIFSISDGDEVQSILPFIKYEWVKEIIELGR